MQAVLGDVHHEQMLTWCVVLNGKVEVRSSSLVIKYTKDSLVICTSSQLYVIPEPADKGSYTSRPSQC